MTVGTIYTFKEISKIPNCSCIYVIRNTVNTKEYVGKTQALRKRLIKHLSSHVKGESILYKAMLKHGLDNFLIEVLEDTVAKEHGSSYEREIYNIKLRSTMAPAGYNMTGGGEGMLGWKMSEETKAKKRAIAATNPSYVQKFKEFIKQPRSAEHRQAISLANKKPKLLKRYGADAPSSKAVLLFEKDSLTPRYFTTQKDLALYLGVDKTSVGNWLQGKGCSIPGIAVASA